MSDKRESFEWMLEKMSAAKAGKPRVPKAKLTTPSFSLETVKSLEPEKTNYFNKPKEKADLTSTKQKELELWKVWKESNYDPQHLNPLMSSMKRLIEENAKKYKNKVEIPTAAIDFEYKQRFVDALKRFNPEKSAMNTWITNYLKKAGRFIKTNQNFARIPENIADHIGKFNATRGELRERLGHEPDDITIAEATGFSLKDVKRLNKEQRKNLIISGTGEQELGNAISFSSREWEVIHLIYHQLSPEERLVHEYSFGLNGKPMLKSGLIAKKLKMDSSKVSKLRTAILNKMKPHLSE